MFTSSFICTFILVMKKKDVVIKKIISLAWKEFPESEIILYGSRARGDNRRDSDWDLLVLIDAPDISFNREREIIDDFYELEMDVGEVFSPLIYRKSDWERKYMHTPLFENVTREGIKIK